MRIYLIGSLRNTAIPSFASLIRENTGHEVFDDWFAAGPRADDTWKLYERSRGRTYEEALKGYAARNTFAFDRKHIDAADAGVMVLPAGRSGHLELGYLLGRGRPGYILLDDDPERWDVMYQFATGIFSTLDPLYEALRRL